MTSKSKPEKSTGRKEAFEYPVDSCNHLVSTSLRDLNQKYKRLNSETAKASDRDENRS